VPRLRNPRQERFAQALAKGTSAIEAHRRAGYKPDRGGATRLQQRASISQRVAELQAQDLEKEEKARALAIEKSGVNQAKVLREYARLAFSDMRRFVDWGPDGVKLKASSELSDDEAAAVAEVMEIETVIDEKVTTRRLRFKLHDKKGALDSIGKHLGMFADRRKLSAEHLQQFLAALAELIMRHVPEPQQGTILLELEKVGGEMYAQPKAALQR
jgi:phage terminase small subunit